MLSLVSSLEKKPETEIPEHQLLTSRTIAISQTDHDLYGCPRCGHYIGCEIVRSTPHRVTTIVWQCSRASCLAVCHILMKGVTKSGVGTGGIFPELSPHPRVTALDFLVPEEMSRELLIEQLENVRTTAINLRDSLEASVEQRRSVLKRLAHTREQFYRERRRRRLDIQTIERMREFLGKLTIPPWSWWPWTNKTAIVRGAERILFRHHSKWS